MAEAEGPTAATLAFVNERRAVGTQPPLAASATGEEIMAALRDQRSRDFYLDGHRVGNLRRYMKQGINDPSHQFPTGIHPGTDDVYGDATCFAISQGERSANPNL